MSLRLFGAVALLILAGSAPGVAAQATAVQPSVRSKIDELIKSEMASQHIPGLALAVTRDGRLVFAQGYGLANVELGVPVTEKTVFKIGSVSKQFIATGVVLLAQDGKLSLDDLVSARYPGTPPSWAPITLRELLSHTAGIIREGPAFDPLKIQPDSVVIQSAFAAPLVFAPGTKWQYCNVCYFTLADIIRRTSGMPWADFIRDRVFKPAGMIDSRTTTTTDLVPRRASGYIWRDGGYAPAMEFLALRPSGAFLSTVVDLARWDSVLSTDVVLKSDHRERMWRKTLLGNGSAVAIGDSTAPGSYGLGWFVDGLDGHRRAQHGGALPGFRAQMSRYLDDGLGIIILTNGDGAQPGRIDDGVARLIFAGRATK